MKWLFLCPSRTDKSPPESGICVLGGVLHELGGVLYRRPKGEGVRSTGRLRVTLGVTENTGVESSVCDSTGVTGQRLYLVEISHTLP